MQQNNLSSAVIYKLDHECHENEWNTLMEEIHLFLLKELFIEPRKKMKSLEPWMIHIYTPCRVWIFLVNIYLTSSHLHICSVNCHSKVFCFVNLIYFGRNVYFYCYLEFKCIKLIKSGSENIMLQIYIYLHKFCSFKLYIHQRIQNQIYYDFDKN